jgi:molybdopterin-guanine dinucleotide biosynthesis protein A
VNRPLAGIFVGGDGSRMGGLAKGLLRTSDGRTVVERSRAVLESAGARIVLVGAGRAYDGLGLEVLADEPHGIGPLGGLLALLRVAGDAPALALAGDMPFVTRALVARLVAADDGAAIVAPRRDGRWEPLCARYHPARVLPLARAHARSGNHSLQLLLEAAGAIELSLAPGEATQLHDWDTPDDVSGGPAVPT